MNTHTILILVAVYIAAVLLCFWSLLEAHVSFIDAYGEHKDNSDHTPFRDHLKEAHERTMFNPLSLTAQARPRALLPLGLYSIFLFGYVFIWSARSIDDEDVDASPFARWCIRRITCGKVNL